MKKLSVLLILILVLVHRAAAQYFVTNDLPNYFTLFYFTNNGSGNVFSLSTNTGPGTNYVISASTNGPTGIGIQPTNATFYLLTSFTNLPFGTDSVSGIFTNALIALQPPLEIVPQWQSILKSYFITGSIPSQQNYWEWIDTMFFYISQTYLYSQAAASNATFTAGLVAQKVAEVRYNISGSSSASPTITFLETNGVSSNSISSGNVGTVAYAAITNWFKSPLTNMGAAFFDLAAPVMQSTNQPASPHNLSAITGGSLYTAPGYGMNSNCFWFEFGSTSSTTNQMWIQIYD